MTQFVFKCLRNQVEGFLQSNVKKKLRSKDTDGGKNLICPVDSLIVCPGAAGACSVLRTSRSLSVYFSGNSSTGDDP